MPAPNQNVVQIHRFGDLVAIHLGDGCGGSAPTVYLPPEQAEAIATALSFTAFNVQQQGFSDSECGTVRIKPDGTYEDQEE